MKKCRKDKYMLDPRVFVCVGGGGGGGGYSISKVVGVPLGARAPTSFQTCF